MIVTEQMREAARKAFLEADGPRDMGLSRMNAALDAAFKVAFENLFATEYLELQVVNGVAEVSLIRNALKDWPHWAQQFQRNLFSPYTYLGPVEPSRADKHLAALEDFAKTNGKADDGEGLLEFYARTHYAKGRDDAIAQDDSMVSVMPGVEVPLRMIRYAEGLHRYMNEHFKGVWKLSGVQKRVD